MEHLKYLGIGTFILGNIGILVYFFPNTFVALLVLATFLLIAYSIGLVIYE